MPEAFSLVVRTKGPLQLSMLLPVSVDLSHTEHVKFLPANAHLQLMLHPLALLLVGLRGFYQGLSATIIRSVVSLLFCRC